MKSQGRSEKATVTTPAESIIDNGIGAEAGLEGTPIRDDIEEAIPNGGLLAWMQGEQTGYHFWLSLIFTSSRELHVIFQLLARS